MSTAASPIDRCSYVCLGVPMAPAPTTVEVHGPALREIRIRSGLDVQELADAVGVQRPYIAKLELGHSRRVSPKVFNALVTTLSLQDRRAIMANPFGFEPPLYARSTGRPTNKDNT